ncbi:hypothetical protein DFH08DRAFT_706356, partial [Mycena albidolilacea]
YLFILAAPGAQSIVPPVTACTRPECNNANLSEKRIVEARLYTLRRGIIPIFSKSLYCRGCHTRYYHNYSVSEAENPEAQRQYYAVEVPKYIHVFESCYVEQELCHYFGSQLCLNHSTSKGIAKVYNLSLAHTSEDHSASHLKDELEGDLVLEAFFLDAILRDKAHRGLCLSLPHHGLQNHRLDAVLAKRNYIMVGTGQEMWAHTCSRCTRIYEGEDGNWYRMSAGVHDGVAVRMHACCVHGCTEALLNQRHLYCHSHRDLMNVCCVRGCNTPTEPGFRTCTEPTHRAFQMAAEQKNTAMFQLHSRLRQTGVSQASLAGASGYSRDPLHQEPQQDPGTEPAANPKLKGHLHRGWTNNEQLFVRCCGMIISRATFFGSEGVSGVNTFLKATFPPQYPGSMPSYMFYDNNCSFLKHLKTCDDHYFDNVGLPVDVFHFKCKHTENDIFCQMYCNPALFQELIGSDGKWVFNSSAAEQANVWFGKFKNVVQEMPVIRYNFFLDEMIAIHNKQTATELESQGHMPHLLSEAFLRGHSSHSN